MKITDTMMLDWWEKNRDVEVGRDYDAEALEPDVLLFRVTGNINDREWQKIARGYTLREALSSAMTREALSSIKSEKASITFISNGPSEWFVYPTGVWDQIATIYQGGNAVSFTEKQYPSSWVELVAKGANMIATNHVEVINAGTVQEEKFFVLDAARKAPTRNNMAQA